MSGTVATGSTSSVVGGQASCCDYCQLPIAGVPDGTSGPLYCCYGCHFAADVAQASGPHARLNWLVTRLGLSIFLSMAVMVFALYHYSQEFVAPGAGSELQSSLTAIMRYGSMLFATPVVLLLGLPIADDALTRLRRGQLSSEFLVTLGVAAAFAYSYYHTVIGSGAIYFETTCMILVLFTCGRWLEASQRLNATELLGGLASLWPEWAVVRRDDGVVEIAPDEVAAGDVVIVPPGQRCCVDGVIIEGRSEIDNRMLTGESRSRIKQVGDDILAGMTPQDGTLAVQAQRVGAATTVGRFEVLLAQARTSRGHFERLADRIATVFIPLTALFACCGLVAGFERGGFGEGILTALAVVLIACPCALGIATPLAVWAALGRAAGRGILVRHPDTLERLATVRTVCFDKTGTLTTDMPEVVDIHHGPDSARARMLALSCGLAQASAHVLSRAIAAWCRGQQIRPLSLTDTKTIGGRGLHATCDGCSVRLGNRALMAESHVKIDDDSSAFADRAAAAGHSVVFVSWGTAVIGVWALNEVMRAAARSTVDKLKRMGCEVNVLTGDEPRRAERLGDDLGVDVHAGLTPAEKIERIQRLQRRSRVVMVGEGLNDAPALAAGDVGIALGCGADLSRESADACLLGDDLAAIPWLMSLSRRTTRTIRRNLFWAFVYNVIGIGFALAGQLNPILAAGAMVLSSVVVVGHALRLAHDPGGEPS